MLDFVTPTTMLRNCVLLILLLFFDNTFSTELSCRDEHNRPVDWFVMYKLPIMEEANNELVEKGEAYAYITSETKKGWTLSKKPIDDRKSILGQTLKPLYESRRSKQHMLYFMYNDQPPTSGTPSGGHTKGVVAAGSNGGFWLVHSVPRFPSVPEGRRKYNYPDSGKRNAQSFLCITLKPGDLEVVGSQIMYNEVHVYSKSVPKKLKDKYPNLAAAAGGEIEDGLKKVQDIESADGQIFRVFAKKGKFHKELYTDFVAPNLEVDLIVQTWPNSPSHQRSSCGSEYYVENVDEIRVAGVTFPSTKDHSQWAVSADEYDPWVCVGDIIRDDPQEKRGGGTVCTKDMRLWNAYQDVVLRAEWCEKER